MERLYVFENFISEDDCETILNMCKSTLTMSEGKVGSNNTNNKVRKSSVAFIDKIESVDSKLISLLKENIILKGFEVTGLGSYQFTEYSLGEYYDWHTDSGGEYSRFYSVVIQLNDTYDGGILEVEDMDKTVLKMKKGIGNMYIFQSNIKHRVTPVLEGVRYSLVNWVSLNKIENFKKTLI
jgi:PKHD-type hydroxylase